MTRPPFEVVAGWAITATTVGLSVAAMVAVGRRIL